MNTAFLTEVDAAQLRPRIKTELEAVGIRCIGKTQDGVRVILKN